jgi:hypothetical protein
MTDSISVEPFLLRFATTRQPEPSIGGHYCDVRQVWVITLDGEERPIVLTDAAGAELMTKTRVLAESDDESGGALSELTTKTKVVVEQDDEDPRFHVSLARTVDIAGIISEGGVSRALSRL